MEAQVLELLKATQNPAQGPRMAAEVELKQLHADGRFASALATIGAHTSIELNDRQAALIALKTYVGQAWSASLEDHGGTVVVPADAKAAIREQMLGIVFDRGSDSKITAATASVVATIAKADFPEEWPTLLDSLLSQIRLGNDGQVQAILVVLAELIQGGLDEEQFYRYADGILKALHGIAVAGDKKLMARAHAVNVFRSCLDFVENLKDRDDDGIEAFAKRISEAWAPFFMDAVKEPMPAFPSSDEEELSKADVAVHWRGVVALKVQVILTLSKMQSIFPELLGTREFFGACWQAMQSHGAPYYASYVDGDRQGGLINQYQLPYTFDFLVIEEIDYLQTLLEGAPVKAQLEEMFAADVNSNGTNVKDWITQVLGALVTFSSITNESEGMWDVDFNIFLTEEAFADTNNTPRSVCAGFIWKICGWFPKQTVEGLLGYITAIFNDESSTWRHKEAALYMLQQVAEEYDNENRVMDPATLAMCVDYVRPTMNDGNPFLRARGHIVMAALMVTLMTAPDPDYAAVMDFAQQSVKAMDSDESDVVKVSCIRLMRDYLIKLPGDKSTELQVPVVNSIIKFLDSQDMEDMEENVDLVDVILQTLRDTIMANATTCLDYNALDIMIQMVKYGAARDSTSCMLIEEAFESAAEVMAHQGGDAYTRLCHKILPSIMASFDVEDPSTTEKTTLTDIASTILKILAQCAIQPLPPGFVSSAMPRLCRLIFSDVDFYIRQEATLTIKHMLSNDKDQVFSWVDPQLQKNGLEMCFLVIGHLLGPQVDDDSAAEVGELAVEVIEKVGTDLGSSVHELLQILAVRLSTAKRLSLIQSLVMVFARLSLINPTDMVNFLAGLQIGHVTALEVVMKAWLENAAHFVGFDSIRQNITALVAIYNIADVRIAALSVQGDLIPDTSSRIKTRSMAKSQPIQHTITLAPLKIIKMLVNELVPPGTSAFAFKLGAGTGGQTIEGPVASGMAKGTGSDGSWESESSTGLSPRESDDVTQAFLVDFFKSHGAEPGFQELFAQLTDAERKRCADAVAAWQSVEAQRADLASRGR